MGTNHSVSHLQTSGSQSLRLRFLSEILQMNPKPASMFAFSRPSCKTDARCWRWRLDDQMNVQLEPDVPAAIIDELKSRGHRTIRSDRLSTEFGRGQFIYKLDDGYFTASEKRTDGQAVGF
jgi:hypothetical protein